MTKDQLKSFLASHGWEETKHGNFTTFIPETSKYGIPMLIKYVIKFYGKSMVEVRKEDITLPDDAHFFYKYPRIANSKLMGVQLREEDSVCIGGVVIK